MATFTNQATLSYNNVTVNSNIATGELLETVAVTKTAVDIDYIFDDTITYVVNIVNSGPTNITAATLTDNLGAYTAGTPATTVYPLSYVDTTARLFVNGVEQNPASITGGPQLIITGIAIPAGGNATVVYDAKVTSFAPLSLGSSIDNTVTVSGTGQATSAEAMTSVPVREDADIEIFKSISPGTVAENGTVTYTFTIQNFGNSPLNTTDNAIISDNFNPVLSGLSVIYNGTGWTQGTNYTYENGVFKSANNQISVPAASYTVNQTTGEVSTVPGTSTLTVSGTI